IATSPTLATPFLKNFLKKINHLELPRHRFLSSEGANYTGCRDALQAFFSTSLKFPAERQSAAFRPVFKLSLAGR
ncbi:hypothetical protein, partial [Microbulbifer thermotolerans]|uniref:hypothetical protein n=1 Tax=Microbulbifer thermotolerans TaxID=252514 RepID=UPI00224AD7A2